MIPQAAYSLPHLTIFHSGDKSSLEDSLHGNWWPLGSTVKFGGGIIIYGQVLVVALTSSIKFGGPVVCGCSVVVSVSRHKNHPKKWLWWSLQVVVNWSEVRYGWVR